MTGIHSPRPTVKAFALRWGLAWALASACLVGFLGLGGKTVTTWHLTGAMASFGGALLFFGGLLHSALNRDYPIPKAFLPAIWAAAAVATLFAGGDGALVDQYGPIAMAAFAGLLGFLGSAVTLLVLTKRLEVAVVAGSVSGVLFAVTFYLGIVIGYLAAILWGSLPQFFYGALAGGSAGAMAGSVSAPLYRWLLSLHREIG